MFYLDPTPANHPELQQLITELDNWQNALYPADSCHSLDLQAQPEAHIYCLIARTEQGERVGCGAVVLEGENKGEIKRMYIRPAWRGHKLGEKILACLEDVARQHSLPWLRLETGIHQHAAIRLYQNCQFEIREAFAPYQPDPLSVFMEKALV